MKKALTVLALSLFAGVAAAETPKVTTVQVEGVTTYTIAERNFRQHCTVLDYAIASGLKVGDRPTVAAAQKSRAHYNNLADLAAAKKLYLPPSAFGKK